MTDTSETTAADPAAVAAPGFSLDSAAVRRVAELLAAEGDDTLVLRVAVRPGGCSGFSYEMFFDTAGDGDVISVHRAGDAEVTVAIDPSSAVLLDGASLSHRDGLDRSGFHVSNPNAQRTCGCGQSFS